MMGGFVMSESSDDPGGRAMLIFNLVGISLAVGLLGSFFWLYGDGFLGLLILLVSPPGFPDI